MKIKKDRGAVNITASIVIIMIVIIMIFFTMKMKMYYNTKTYVDDAITGANLAAATIDMEGQYANKNINNYNYEDMYETYLKCLGYNLDSKVENPTTGTVLHPTNEVRFASDIEVLRFYVYNKDKDGNIKLAKVVDNTSDKKDGVFGIVEQSGLSDADAITPDGTQISDKESTMMVYSQIGFELPSLFGNSNFFMSKLLPFYITKQHTVDVVNNHNYQRVVTKEPTCDEPGEATYTCIDCGQSYVRPIDPLGHLFEEKDSTTNWSSVVSETDEAGNIQDTRTVILPCETPYTFTYDVNSTNYTLYIENSSGRTVLVDQFNGTKTDTVTVRLDEGENKIVEIKEPSSVVTLTLPVITYSEGHKCTRCGLEVEHTMSENVIQEATCTESGEYTKTCLDCGYTYTIISPALKHIGSWKVTVTPTCITGGKREYTCKRCGITITENLDALGHIDDNDDNICDRCGEEIIEFSINKDNCYMAGLTADGEMIIPGLFTYMGTIYKTTKIEANAFNGCNITKMYIPKTVKLVQTTSFNGVTGLKDIEVDEDNLAYTSYQGVLFTRDMQKLMKYPVAKEDTSYEVPEDVIDIESNAFNNNYLKKINISYKVKNIKKKALSECLNLESINVDDNNVTYSAENGVLFNKYQSELILYPKNKQDMAYIIPDSVRTIKEGAFENVPGKIENKNRKIVLPAGLKRIEARAFANDDELKAFSRINIPQKVSIIGENAFLNVGMIFYYGTATGSTWGAKAMNKETPFILTSANFYMLGITASTYINLPSTFEYDDTYYRLTGIDNTAFRGNTTLQRIYIPESVTNIGTQTFNGCTKLENIEVSTNNNDYLSDDGVLYSSDGKTLIRFPEGRTYSSYKISDKLTKIEENAFSNCTKLGELLVPNTITSIGTNAFLNVKQVYYNGTATGNPWGALALSAYKNFTITNDNIDELNLSLTGTVEIPATFESEHIGYKVIAIGYMGGTKKKGVFYGNTRITAITIPDTVNTIGSYAFANCSNLQTVITPSTMKSLGNGAFENCYNLSSFTIPDGITEIKQTTFKNCQQLKSIVLPSSLNSMLDETFNGCISLTSISIPNTVDYIGQKSFMGCTSLTSVKLPSSLVMLNNSMFENCSSLETINLGSNLATIGSAVFKNCTALQTITIPDKVTLVSEELFKGCTNLKSAIINAHISSMPNEMFSGCKSLSSINIPNSVTKIGNKTFYNCQSLGSIVLPSVKTIGDEAFVGCDNIKTVDFAAITSIGKSAFKGLTGLTTLTFPNTTTLIDDYAFKDCINVNKITLGNAIERIGIEAFANINKVEALNLSNTAEIDQGAFSGMDSLAEITILNKNAKMRYPDSIPEDTIIVGYNPSTAKDFAIMYDRLFVTYGTKTITETVDGITYSINLTNKQLTFASNTIPDYEPGMAPWHKWAYYVNEVVIPNNVPRIGNNAFYDMKYLKKVTFTATSTCKEIGISAFENSKQLASIVDEKTEETIPTSVTNIQSKAFKNTNLSGVTLRVSNIEDEAFANISAAKNIVIGMNVSTIAKTAFNNTSIESLTINTKDLSGHNNAFEGNPNIKGLILNNTTAIPDNYFKNCTGLTGTVTIPDSCTSIGESSFENSGVQFVEAKTKSLLSNIKENAFKDCESLFSIQILNPETNIADPNSLPKRTIIVGIDPSTASEYAEVNDRPFVPYGSKAIKGVYGNISWNIDITSGAFTMTCTGAISDFEKGTAPWYKYESYIKSITIPNTVTRIGNYAFCDALFAEKLTFTATSTCESIGTGAFEGCNKLASVIDGKTAGCLPASVKTIENNAFKDNSITAMTIQNNCTSIGESAFANNKSLNTLVIGTGVKTIGVNAFENCALETSVTLNASLDEDNHIFTNNKTITKVVLGTTITKIPDGLFKGCSSLTGTIAIPATCETIGNEAFRGTKITGLTLAAGVTTIGDYAFSADDNTITIASLSIPDTVTSIGQNAFENWKQLATVAIGKNASIIGANAFKNAPIGKLTLNIANIQAHNDNFNNRPELKTLVLANTTSLPNHIFEGCTSLTGTITIPNTCTAIGESAFNGCVSITGLSLGTGVKTIGNKAFYGYSKVITTTTSGVIEYDKFISIATLTIPNTVTTIGESAFANWIDLNTLTIGTNVTSIGSNAFYKCPLSANILFTAKDLKETNDVFVGNETIKKVTINSGVTQIPAKLFKDCTNLESVYNNTTANNIVASVTSIGDDAFNNTGLKTITLANTTGIKLGARSFANCRQLATFAMGNGTKELGESVFENSAALKTCTLGTGITEIPNRAFYGTAIETLSIPNNITVIGENAYGNCQKLKTITTLADSKLMMIKDAAFDNCNYLYMITLLNKETEIASETSLPSRTIICGYEESTAEAYATKYDRTFIAYGSKIISGTENGVTYNINTATGAMTISVTGDMPDYAPGKAPWYEYGYYIKSITIPNTCTRIGNYAFYDLPSLTTVTFTATSTCTSIGKSAFANSPLFTTIQHGTTKAVIPDSIVNIEDGAFAKVPFAALTIGAKCENIGRNAFKDTKIATLVLGASVKTLSENAFENAPLATLTIKSNIKDHNGVFANSEYLKTVTINNGITQIPDGIFENDAMLTGTITIPATCISIGSRAFKNTKITTLTFASGTKCEAIGEYAFADCNSLTTITGNALPATLKQVDQFAFYGCALTTINVNTGVTVIKQAAFANNTKLASVTIGAAVDTIEEHAFANCPITTLAYNAKNLVNHNDTFANHNTLKTVTFGATVTELPEGIFRNGKQITGTIAIPAACLKIGNAAFSGCSKITGLTLNKGIQTIGDYAFSANTKEYMITDAYKTEKEVIAITALTIPDSITSIGTNAFADWTKLNTLTLGTELVTIEKDAFINDPLNTKITINSSNLNAHNNVFVNNTSIKTIAFGTAVKKIPNRLFKGCSNITGTITIPATCLTIGDEAFSGCNKITALTLTNGIQTIGDYAFSANTKEYMESDDYAATKNVNTIASLTIPNTVTSIGTNAFADSSKLTTLILGTGLQTIGIDAFKENIISVLTMNCTNLTEDNNNFTGNNTLVRVVLADSVTNIPDEMFKDCTELTTIWRVKNENVNQISSAMKTIGNSAFENTGLTAITFTGATTQGERAFANCASLASVNTGAKVTEIGVEAFSHNPKLKTFTIGAAVTTIKKGALSYTIIPSITFPDNIQVIEDEAFKGTKLAYANTKTTSKLKSLGADVFEEMKELCILNKETTFEETTAKPNTIICGYDPSTAKEYAETYNRTFILHGTTNLTETFEGGTYTINTSTGAMSFKLTGTAIPDYEEDQAPWHKYRLYVKSITIPKTCASIGNYAFNDLPSLTTVTFEATATCKTIGEGSFKGCKELVTMALPATLTEIGNNAFENTGFTALSIPNAVTTIGDNVYAGTKIATLALGTGLNTIGTSAFKDDPIKTITVNSTNLTTHNNVFANNKSITTVAFGTTVKQIPDRLFKGCESITGTITIPATCLTIGNEAFSGCNKITALTLTNGIQTIGDYAFSANTKEYMETDDYLITKNINTIASLTIPNTVTSIGTNAFADSSNLTTLILGTGLQTIGIDAFKENIISVLTMNCTNLTEDNNNFTGNNTLVRVVLADSVTNIPDEMFKDCTELAKIWRVNNKNVNQISSAMKTIGNSAFENTGLTAITFTGATTQGERAFANCSSLASVNTGAKVTEIGVEAFSHNSKLKTFTIGAAVTTIKKGALSYTAIPNITFPDNIKVIEDEAFKGTKLSYAYTNATSKLESLGNDVFDEMKELRILNKTTAFEETTAKPNTIICGYVDSTAKEYADTYNRIFLEYGLKTITGTFDGGKWSIDQSTGALTFALTGTEIPSFEKDKAPWNNYSLYIKSITIPKACTTIGDNAFYNLEILTTVTFEATATCKTIGNSSFADCSELTTMTLPASLQQIGNNAFENTGFTTLSIPNAVTTIGNNAYAGTKIATITLGTGLNTIGTDAFQDAPITTVTINSTNLTTHNNVFANRETITKIAFGTAVTNIADNLFKGCSSLTGTIAIPATCKTIGNEAFSGCNQITALTLTNGIQTIGDYAFSANTKEYIKSKEYNTSKNEIAITTLTIPNTVTTIGEGTFADWTKLNTLSLGTGLTTIGKDAFKNCPLNTKLTILATNLTTHNNVFAGNKTIKVIAFGNITQIPNGLFKGCESITGTITIPATCLTIGDEAFSGCNQITALTLTNGIQTIGDYAFSANTKEYMASANYESEKSETAATTLTIPNTVTTIGVAAFADWTKLNTLSLGTGLTTIGKFAFENAPLNTKLVISATNLTTHNNVFMNNKTITNCYFGTAVTIIPDNLFKGCSSLKTIYNNTAGNQLPASVTQIGKSAFENNAIVTLTINNTSGCTIGNNAFKNNKITALNIGNGCTAIGDGAFAGNEISSLALGTELTAIGKDAFANSPLNKITLNSTNLITHNNVFANNKSITTVVLGTTVKQIPDGLFKGCESITGTITIPATCLTIGDEAFSGCNQITALTLTNGIQTIGDYAFSANTKEYMASANYESEKAEAVATTLTVPNTVTTIGEAAFADWTKLNTLSLGTGLTTIGKDAFKNAPLNTKLIINSTKLTTTNNVFTGNKTIANCYFGTAVTIIPDELFKDCDGLKAIYNNTTGNQLPASITKIGTSAFENTSITALTLTNKVSAAVGDRAFANNKKLTTIALGTGCQNISNEMFIDCSLLATINLGSSVSIGEKAFYNCDAIKNITLPDSITTVKNGAFENCNNLRYVYTNPTSKLAKVEANAFNNCDKLGEIRLLNKTVELDNETSITKDTVICGYDPSTAKDYADLYNRTFYVYGSKTVTGAFENGTYTVDLVNGTLIFTMTQNGEIPDYLPGKAPWYKFAYYIKTITIPNKCTRVGNYAFYDFENLATVTYQATSVCSSIGESAFEDCPVLATTTLPNTITKIENNAFKNNAFTAFTVPNNCIEIGDNSFSGNSKLATLTLGTGLTTIGQNAFEACPLNTKITINSTKLNEDNNTFSGNETITTVVFGTAVTNIPNELFKDCIKLVNIYNGAAIAQIPASVTTIGDSAFENTAITTLSIMNTTGCTLGGSSFANSKLTALNVGNGCTTIGPNAFANNEIVTLTLGTNITTIGEKAFENNPLSTKIAFNSKNITEHNNVFVNNKTIKTVAFGNTVTKIPDNIFSGCNGITGTLTIPANVTEIGNNAFKYDTEITVLSFAYGTKCTTIGEGTFMACNKLATIQCLGSNGTPSVGILPATIQTIKKDAFYGTAITTINVNNGCITIGETAFKNCYSLVTLTLGTNVNSIGVNAFDNAPLSTKIVINSTNLTTHNDVFAGNSTIKAIAFGNVTQIPNGLFKGCENITAITIPATCTTIGDEAFSGCYKITALTFAAKSKCTSIGSYAFSANTKENPDAGHTITIKSTIPSAATIGENAFEGWTTM